MNKYICGYSPIRSSKHSDTTSSSPLKQKMLSFTCNRPESIKISEEKCKKAGNLLVERFCMGIRPYSTVIHQGLRPFVQECITLCIA